MRFVVFFLSGVVLGGALVWNLLPAQPTRAALAPLVIRPSASDCARELEAVRAEVVDLRRGTTVSDKIGAPKATPVHPAPVTSEPEHFVESAESPQAGDAVQWRVSAIEKFVPLSAEQRQRLREKFEKEVLVPSGEEPGTESLEDIVGEESARFYRQQVQAAFQKVQNEALDREVVWLARQLTLSPDQEQALRSVFEAVERQIEAERLGDSVQGVQSPQSRVRAMVTENRKRADLRNEQLKGVLSPEQYEIFLRSQAESSDADVELFHN